MFHKFGTYSPKTFLSPDSSKERSMQMICTIVLNILFIQNFKNISNHQIKYIYQSCRHSRSVHFPQAAHACVESPQSPHSFMERGQARPGSHAPLEEVTAEVKSAGPSATLEAAPTRPYQDRSCSASSLEAISDPGVYRLCVCKATDARVLSSLVVEVTHKLHTRQEPLQSSREIRIGAISKLIYRVNIGLLTL